MIILTIFCSDGYLYAQLQADFSTDKSGGCSPLAVSFTNKTTGASLNAVYNWDFGNGNNSSLFDGGAIYTMAQTYLVTLTVTDGSNTSSKTSQITVYKNPVIDFSASVPSGCIPLAVIFTANANPGNGNLSSYTWDFGDGNTQNSQSNIQSHIYSAIQNPIVNLTVVNSFGCHTTLQKTGLVNVLAGVTASFSADKNFLCLINDPVQFTNTSTGPGTLSYQWNFGDGNASTQKNPQYSFNKKGIYTVSLQVTSSAGCVATDTLSNTLNVANYNTDFNIPSILCKSAALTFTNNSSPVPDNSNWAVDGIAAGNSKDLGYSFSTSGAHTISLSNTFGSCSQSLTKNIVINDLPGPAGFSYTEQGKCGPPEAVVFNDLSNATQHEWDFNYNYYSLNITSTDQQPTFTYPAENVYNIWLRSTNAAGCSITTIQQIFLSPPLVWIYSNGGPDTCGKASTQTFTCSKTNLTSYLWHFGDGTTSTEVSPTHVYSIPGGYSPYLTYTDANGCSGTSNYLAVHVSPLLQPDFIATNTTVCGNTGIELHGTTSDPNTVYWLWSYGDGQYSYDVYADAIHVYNQPGTYTITLYVTNFGCTDSIMKTDYITVTPPFF
ncbi:MAG TPA: PKD domain-containing protein, partial [Puia sp.]|nr:PKD domain-containing protein [Puia sp.]